jgi:hypothetical protein
MKEIANYISYIHRFFRKMRLTDQQVSNAFFIGTIPYGQGFLSSPGGEKPPATRLGFQNIKTKSTIPDMNLMC